MRLSRTIGCCACFALIIAGATLAQDAEGGGKHGGRGGRDQSRPRHSAGLRDPRHLSAQMKSQLKLDATQEAEIGKILDDYKAANSELRKMYTPSPDFGPKMIELRDAMKAAREAKDNARLHELIEQMKALGAENEQKMAPMRQKMEEAQTGLHDKLAGILHEDQKGQFETLWKQETMGRQAMTYRGPVHSGKVLKDLVDKLTDLTTEQRRQLDELFKKNLGEKRAADAKDSGAERRVNRKLYADVFAVLTDAQKEKLTPQLESIRERGRKERGKDDKGGKGSGTP